MNPQDLIDLIVQEVKTNNNNEITAAVLQPVLIAMVEQINELVGSKDDIPNGLATIVESLQDIIDQAPQGLTIHTGQNNPNDQPPATYDIGDFYHQTSQLGASVAFYIYNGKDWAEQLTREQSYLRPIVTANSGYTVQSGDSTIIYEGTDASDVIDIPTPQNNRGRTLKFVNLTNINVNFTSAYYYGTGGSQSQLLAGEVVHLQSDSNKWIKIN